MLQIAAADFKTHCLHYMDLTNTTHEIIVITKRGKPVAKLVPYNEEPPELFGKMKGSVTIHGDILEPIDTEWEVLKNE